MRVPKKSWRYRARCCSSFVDRLAGQCLIRSCLIRSCLSGLMLDLNYSYSLPIGDTSNFKYTATKVPFEAGDYLIFRPKVDRWVDSTQCDYGELRSFTNSSDNLLHFTSQ